MPKTSGKTLPGTAKPTSKLADTSPAAAAAAGDSDQKKEHKKRRSNHKNKLQYGIYLHRLLRHDHPAMHISQKGLLVMEAIVRDVAQRLLEQGATLGRANHRQTLTSRELATAVRLCLPGELATHAHAEGGKALLRYKQSHDKDSAAAADAE
jgi:histone H2B